MKTADVVVIGAGLSGLTAAWIAHQAGKSVLIIEASDRAGGNIGTHLDDGFLWEAGPHTFPSTATELVDLCAQLQVTPVPAQAAHRRYLYINGTLTALPEKPPQAVTTKVLSFPAKIRALLEVFRSKITAEDISIADFFKHRFGRELTEHLIDPFVSGIYAGDIQKLSLPAVFPKLWEWEQATGSVLTGAINAQRQRKKVGQKRAKMQLLSFEHGLQTLTDALVQQLPANALQLNQPVQTVLKSVDGYEISLKSGELINAPNVILAVPAFVGAQLLADLSSLARDLLAQIPYSGLAVVHLGFEKKALPDLDGFGCLVPRKENIDLLGSIWASSLFPNRAPQGQVLLSNFIGGAHNPTLVETSTEQIEEQVLRDLKTIFKSTALNPTFIKTKVYPRAIPQYTLGHQKRMAAIESEISRFSGLALCGNYLHGVALNQCVISGMNAAKHLV